MTISSFDARVVRFKLSPEEEIANISWAKNKKSKDTWTSQTLKVEENTVCLVFFI